MTPSGGRGRAERPQDNRTSCTRSTRPLDFTTSVEQFAAALNQDRSADLLSHQERLALTQLIQAIARLLGEEVTLEHST
jgi:hypothetical protein